MSKTLTLPKKPAPTSTPRPAPQGRHAPKTGSANRDAARPGTPRPARTDRTPSTPQPGRPASTRPARPASSDDPIRLNKRLAELGLCSRREGDEWIERGWVKVNGTVAQMGMTVTAQDRIDVLPQATAQQGARVTILLHKPIGYVSG